MSKDFKDLNVSLDVHAGKIVFSASVDIVELLQDVTKSTDTKLDDIVLSQLKPFLENIAYQKKLLSKDFSEQEASDT